MKTETTKDIAYYENLPYTITVRKDEDGDFVARIQELPGCLAHGDTESVAIEHLRSVQKLWIEEALEADNDIPEPEAESQLPSGKWVQRVPRRLHRDLVALAQRDNVSLNQLVTSMLSEALTAKSCMRVLESYLSQMHVPAHSSSFFASYGGAGYQMWCEPEDVNRWFMKPHARPEKLAQSIEVVKAVTKALVSSPSFDRYDENYIEGRFLARK